MSEISCEKLKEEEKNNCEGVINNYSENCTKKIGRDRNILGIKNHTYDIAKKYAKEVHNFHG